MQAILQAAPQLMEVAGDLLVKNLDWPGADELAERLKKTIPPELQDEESNKSATGSASNAADGTGYSTT